MSALRSWANGTSLRIGTLNSSAVSQTLSLTLTGALTFCVHSAGAAPPLAVHRRKPVQLTKSVGSALVFILYVRQRISPERAAVIGPAGRPRPNRSPEMLALTLSSFWVRTQKVSD